MQRRENISVAKKLGAKLIFAEGSGYPSLLAEITDAPPFLWVLGNPEWLNRLAIVVVGARNASSLGTPMANRLTAG